MSLAPTPDSAADSAAQTPPVRVLVADDERLPREQLVAALAKVWPQAHVIGQASHGAEALALIGSLAPDVVFLDIRMPELNGLEVAIEVQRQGLGCAVVFLTAFDEYAIAAFDAQAVDYLLKPIDLSRLTKTVQRLTRALAQQAAVPASPPAEPAGTMTEADLRRLRDLLMPRAVPRLQWVQASVGASVHFIPIDDVLWFRSDDKYTSVRTLQQEAIIRTSLKELEPQLDPERFWTIHRNCIVAVPAIERSERDALGRVRVKIRGLDQWLDVSRSHVQRFKGW